MIVWLALAWAWFAVHVVDRAFPRRVIRRADDSIYLTRRFLFGFWPTPQGWRGGPEWRGKSLYVHCFHAADADSPCVLHTHRFAWAVSLVVLGSYVEQRARFSAGLLDYVWRGGIRMVGGLAPYRRVRWINVLRGDSPHRVERLERSRVWTLFLVGPRAKEGWGFLVPGRGYVPHEEWIAERHANGGAAPSA